MEQSKRKDIELFTTSIDKMLSSKYILVDRRLSDVMQSIAESTTVYNLIAECMINFDFKYEWKKATETNIIKFPTNVQKKIAFIFCLLSNLDNNNIDITTLLDRYFSYNPSHTPYEVFCKTVIEEFKYLITNSIKRGERAKEDSTVKQKEPQQMSMLDISRYDDNYRLLLYKLGELVKIVAAMKKFKGKISKDEFLMILNTFNQAVTEKHQEYFKAFSLMIIVTAGKNKAIKSRLVEIDVIVDEILGGRK